MHFTGQVWRPPFEADNALLQVTSGLQMTIDSIDETRLSTYRNGIRSL